MTQLTYSLDLRDAAMPVRYHTVARTSMQQDTQDGRRAVAYPQLLFGENILPNSNGYKAIAYTQALPPIALTLGDTVVHVQSAASQAGGVVIATTALNKIYIYTTITLLWVDATPVGWLGGDAITLASVNGQTYAYLAHTGLYIADVITGTLLPQTLIGIAPVAILGCISAVNYLILYDLNTVYWSSTVNILDFVPSLISGAGSLIPNDLNGDIISAANLNTGFVLYTAFGAVVASYSNNTRFPFIFVGATGAAGIVDKYRATTSYQGTTQFTLSTAGCQAITAQGAENVLPELTELLQANALEVYNALTHEVVETISASGLAVKVFFLNSKTLVVSIAAIADFINTKEYTVAYVYDVQLKRWGKCVRRHCAVAQSYINPSTQAMLGRYVDFPITTTYASLGLTPVSNLAATANAATIFADTGKSLMLIDSLGVSATVSISDGDAATASGIAVFGQFKQRKGHTLAMYELALDVGFAANAVIAPAPNAVSCTLLTYNDQTASPAQVHVTAALLVASKSWGTTKLYPTCVCGAYHTLEVAGSFRLSDLRWVCAVGGRR